MMNGTESRSKGSAAAGAASDAGKVKKQISYLERQYKVQSETIKEQKKAIERYAAELQVMILCMPACPTDASPSHACLLSHHQLTLFGCAVWFSGSAKGATISRESGSEAGRREHGDKKKWYACFRIPGYQTARVPLRLFVAISSRSTVRLGVCWRAYVRIAACVSSLCDALLGTHFHRRSYRGRG